MSFQYPADLVSEIRKQWSSHPVLGRGYQPALPADEAIKELLDIIYHTSFLKEEGRALSFRLAFNPRVPLDPGGRSAGSDRVAVFQDPRPLTVAELHRLAPATDSRRCMICVDRSPEDAWMVWGILDTGTAWWDFVRHESPIGETPPLNLCFSSFAPGEIVVSRAGSVLVALRNGSISHPQEDVLSKGPVGRQLDRARSELVRAVQGNRDRGGNLDAEIAERFYDSCLWRILFAMSDLDHGGTLILVPHEVSTRTACLSEILTIKYECKYDYAWDLLLHHMDLVRQRDELNLKAQNDPVEKSIYDQKNELHILCNKNSRSLSDCLKFILSLSVVDGAVVMTDRFSVLGFGAEVVAHAPDLRDVQSAAAAEAVETETISIESYGTRHRSAFRFCSTSENALAFIVSQDGGIKATKRVGSQVVLWPEIRSTYFGV